MEFLFYTPIRERVNQYLGRVIETERPGSGGSDTVRTESYYGKGGRLIRQVTIPGNTNLYIYDELGNVVREGVDIDGDGALIESSFDQITDQESAYAKDGNDVWWSESTVYTFADIYAAAHSPVSKTRERLINAPVPNYPGSYDFLVAQSE